MAIKTYLCNQACYLVFSSPVNSASSSRMRSGANRPATRMTLSSVISKAAISGKFQDTVAKSKRPPEGFISIQLEKVVHDVSTMVNINIIMWISIRLT